MTLLLADTTLGDDADALNRLGRSVGRMPRRYRRREGEQIGPWRLVSHLGLGGNAEVWRAEYTANGNTVALKILTRQEAGAEPYRRFRDEQAAHVALGNRPGILPLLECRLPDAPTADDPAWLATPLAVDLEKALKSKTSLEDVVEAIARIAETLASLAGEGYFHRDLKPSNLFLLDGEAVVGDFGLVDFPDKEDVTEKGRQPGPRNYMAPELLLFPDTAEPGPADVYSLAKTLWVLATGFPIPLPGELQIDVPALSVGAYGHPRARQLDLLLDRATRTLPQQRPTMAEFAAELRSWLAPPVTPSTPGDLSDLAGQVRAVCESALRADARRPELIQQSDQLLKRIELRVNEAFIALLGAGFSAEQVSRVSNPIRDLLTRERLGWEDYQVRREGRGIVIQSSATRPLYMWSGMSLTLRDDGQLILQAAHILGLDRHNPKVVWTDNRSPHLGSAQQDQDLEELMNLWTEALRGAVEEFIQLVSTGYW